VLRVDLGGAPSFDELVRRERAAALAAYAHQDLPFERLVDGLHLRRDLARAPLFQVMFILLNTPTAALTLPDATLAPVDIETGAAKFDLTLLAGLRDGRWQASLEYDTDLFDGATAERLGRHLSVLLAAALAPGEVRMAEIGLLSAAERQQLLDWSAAGAIVAPSAATAVHELVGAQIERTPEAVAVAAGSEQLTYRELGRRARRLARRLAALGAGPETRVGVCLSRSPAMVTALLGVLEAGAAYVPIDPAYPRERIALMVEDAAVAILVGERSLASRLPAGRAKVLMLDDLAVGPEAPPARVLPENLAYVIFTSGSTGRPKGVAVCHRGVVNYLTAMAGRPGLAASDVVLALTTLSFDIAVTELLLPITVGARIALVERETAADATLLAATIDSVGATFIQATPAAWSHLLEGGWGGRPEVTALAGGEALPRALADRLGPRVGALWNVYGPTETTVWSALHPVTAGAAEPRPVPIGRPLANTALHLLDRALGLALPGVPGELAIGGVGLARGYIGRPELTAERFVPDPWGALGGRLYRTGDLARWLPDGNLEYLGRIDRQVKVRGFRIEPGEIEAALAALPGVAAAAVMVREDLPGHPQLVAYVAAATPAPSWLEIRAELALRLPAYLVPGAGVVLDQLPLTMQGKIDRTRLPAPDARAGERAAPVAPRTPAERILADIWSQVLRRDQVGVEDNFFEIGGDSVLAFQIVARARRAGVRLDPRHLFQYQTIAALAAHCDGAPGETAYATPDPSEPVPVDFLELDPARLDSILSELEEIEDSV